MAKLVVNKTFMTKASVANGGRRQLRFDQSESCTVDGDSIKFRQFTVEKKTLQVPFDNGWCDVLDEEDKSIFTPSKSASSNPAAKESKAEKAAKEKAAKDAEPKTPATSEPSTPATSTEDKKDSAKPKGKASAVPGSTSASKPADK